MAHPATRSPAPRPGWRAARRWVVAAAAFVAGLLVGGIVVGLVSGDTVVPPSGDGGAEPTASPVTTAPATGTAAATGQLFLSDDCLRAINAAEDLIGLVDDLGDALADFDATRLDEIVRDLQPLQDRLRNGIDDCNVRATIATGSPGVGSSSPSSASPSSATSAAPTT